MSTSDYLLEKLQQWIDLRAQGIQATVEKLCADRPELAAELERQIHKYTEMKKVLPPGIAGNSTSSGSPHANSLIHQHYEILQMLGYGAQGTVYRARERKTGRVVALKKMMQFDPAAVERFRKEARVLMNVNHPNLVTLYDVISDGQQWFFTMELVEGRPFPGHLAWPSTDDPVSMTFDDSLELSADVVPSPASNEPQPPRAPPAEFNRLLAAFAQLADGILALHEHGDGVLHRDIKPSNVLITPEEHVKILDCGLATEIAVNANSQTQQGMAGTLPYMPPEQADGRAEKASDWYSFGVVLYETLTGGPPFRGTSHEMPWTRTGYVPAAVRSLIPSMPEDLSRLCEELLHWDPTKRPTGREVRRRIAPGDSPPPWPPAPPFLGRDSHLRKLADAFKESQDSEPGRAVVVHLHGTSGMGKSALAAHFLQQVRKQQANAVLLRGRCYERESVPYKALAELVDALKKFWRRLSREKAALLVPDEVGPLVQVFPELRVEAIAEAATRGSPESPDPNEQRRRATAGLREVLRRIGKRWPLVICLDDLQWGDLDSAVMLTNLLAPPDPPRLLLLACYRSEDKDGPFLKNFSAPAATELLVEPLSFQESRDLAVTVPGPDAAPLLTPENAKAVAEESGGNPFFVYMLVQAVLAGEPVRLDQVIWTRICSLPEDQRHLLEIVAVAGRPLRTSVAFRAAELADGRSALIHLQHTRMLKGGLAEQQEIETYHDRIRETVVARLTLTPETLRERHRRLAVALESSDRPDPEVLAEHLHRSGELERAGKYYEEAADRAAKILAFDRAATLYRLALEVGRFDGEAKRRLQTSLGKSLANAGRGAEAGQAYLDAAIGAAPAKTLELQHLAGEQFMRAGHIEKGLEVLRFVLRSIGISLPETRRQILWALFWGNIKLWWRGTKFRERDAGQIPADELARIDLCWSIGSILALADTALGSALHRGYFIPLALAAGEPNRVALALGGLACADAITGGPNQQRGDALLRQARDLAERTGVPYTRAEVESMSSVCAILLGQWKEVDAFTRRAESLFRKECTGAAWEIGMSYHYRFAALFFRGEWKQLAQEIPLLLIDARARRDLYTATSLQIHSAHLDIADDEPNRCRETIVKAMRLWPQQGFHLQHYHAMRGEVEASLYAGKPAEAWTTTRERWPDLSESLLLRVQEIRVVMTHLRARSALAAAFALSPGGEQDKLVRSAERDARQLESERMGYANAMAQLIRATIAFHRGKRADAVAILESGAVGLEKADMLLYAESARWQLGKLLGNERGEALIQDAKAFMTGQGIRNPVRILNIYTPGFPAAE